MPDAAPYASATTERTEHPGCPLKLSQLVSRRRLAPATRRRVLGNTDVDREYANGLTPGKCEADQNSGEFRHFSAGRRSSEFILRTVKQLRHAARLTRAGVASHPLVSGRRIQRISTDAKPL